MFLAQQLRAGDPAMEAVYGGFERNLADAVTAARAGGAQVVVSTMGTRLRDFAPLASLHRPGLGEEQLSGWRARFTEGERLEAEGRFAEAAEAWRGAEAIDAEHAELQYRIGLLALASGDQAGARTRLTRARDLDTLRFRADSRIDAIIRRVAGSAGTGVRLVDGAAALAEASDHGLPGSDLFYEHVHLTPAGNYRLAAALLPAVEGALPAGWRTGAVPRAPPALGTCIERLAFTGFDRYRVAKEVLARLRRPPLSGQSDHGGQVRALEREKEMGAAEPFEVSDATYRSALAARPGDPWLRLNYGIPARPKCCAAWPRPCAWPARRPRPTRSRIAPAPRRQAHDPRIPPPRTRRPFQCPEAAGRPGLPGFRRVPGGSAQPPSGLWGMARSGCDGRLRISSGQSSTMKSTMSRMEMMPASRPRPSSSGTWRKRPTLILLRA